MKTIFFMFATIIATFVGGRLLGASVTPLQPLTLTVHTAHGVRVVYADYTALVFDGGAITISYNSDRLFCDSFDGSAKCYTVLP